METCTTDTGATGQDDSHRSHGRQPQEIPEPRTTTVTHWRYYRTSHKRQPMEPLATTNGATSNRR